MISWLKRWAKLIVPSFNIFLLIITVLSLWIHCPEGSLSSKSLINILIWFDKRSNRLFLINTSCSLVCWGFFISLSNSSIVFEGSVGNFLYIYFIFPSTITFWGEFFLSNLFKVWIILFMLLVSIFNLDFLLGKKFLTNLFSK